MRGARVVIAIIAAAACAGTGRAAGAQTVKAGRALVGTWGGERVRLNASGTGLRLQVDCLVAQADAPIVLDKADAFNVAVRFVPLRGVALDGPEDRPLSQVSGRVDRDTLHLTIEPKDSEAAGTFTLQRNGKAKLPNCRLRG